MLTRNVDVSPQVAMIQEAAKAALQGKAEVVRSMRIILVDNLNYMTAQQFTAVLLHTQAELLQTDWEASA